MEKTKPVINNGTELYLHIGLHKTATTFLQYNFFPYLKDITYIMNHHFYLENKEINRKILVSNEKMSGTLLMSYNEEYFHLLNNPVECIFNLKQRFPDAKIMCCLRDPDGWVDSAYNMYLKSGGDMRRHQVYDIYKKLGYLDIENIRNIIDTEFVSYIYDFKDFKKHKNMVLKDICKFMDVDYTSYKDHVLNNRHHNTTLIRYLNSLHKYLIWYLGGKKIYGKRKKAVFKKPK